MFEAPGGRLKTLVVTLLQSTKYELILTKNIFAFTGLDILGEIPFLIKGIIVLFIRMDDTYLNIFNPIDHRHAHT